MKSQKTKRRLMRIMLMFLACTAFLLIGRGAIVAGEFTKQFQPSAFLLIKAKARDAILTPKMRFLITTQTRILNRRGKEMTLRQLPVPCKAKIRYQPFMHSDPEALMIRITRILPGASTNWASPMPE